MVVVQWNLYFVQSDWSIFPEAGLAFLIGDGYHDGPHDDDDVDVVFAASFGARYHFNDRMSLLMRLNFPAGFQIGLTF